MNNTTSTLSLSHANTQTPTANPLTTLTSPAATQTQNQSSTTNNQQLQGHDNTQPTTATMSHPALYSHQISGAGGPTATAPFLRDFSLVAEAAKRAQVAIVTRDLEGVSL